MGGSEIGLRVGASEQRAWQDDVCRAKVQLWEQERLRANPPPSPPCLGDEHPLTPTSCQVGRGSQPILPPCLQSSCRAPARRWAHRSLGLKAQVLSGFPITDLAARAETAPEALWDLRGPETQPEWGESSWWPPGGWGWGLGSADERPGPAWEVGRVFHALFLSLFPQPSSGRENPSEPKGEHS